MGFRIRNGGIMEFSPLWITLKTAFAATGITFFLGIFIAYKMAGKEGKKYALLDGLLNLPLVLPPTVVGFFLLMLFGRNGFLGRILNVLDIQIIFTWAANVIAAVVVSFPLMYKTSKSAFELVDENYIRAAKTLESSQFRIFWRIIFPLSWPGAVAGAVLAFARAMGEFGATLMIAGSITGRTKTIPIAIFFASEAGNDREALYWVLIIVAVSLMITFFMDYWLEGKKRRIKGCP